MKTLSLTTARRVATRSYEKQILLTAEELHSPGTLVQIVTIKPGDRIADHFHQTSMEFYYVLQGECRLVTNGQEMELTPGVMLLMEPSDVHSLHNAGPEEFRLLVLKTNGAGADTFWPDSL